MKTIAVINQKGGVAKSTTAHALGSLLAADGARVLFADMDAQGNLSYALGSDGAGASVYDVLTGAAQARAAIRDIGGVSVLAASPALSAADMVLTQTGKEYRLKEALGTISDAFDYCIIDTPPALGILTVNALTAADGVVIPSQADIFSLQGISQLGGTLDTVRRYCNPSLKVYGLLLVRYNSRAIISREVAALLKDSASSLGTRLFSAPIRECTAVKEAQASRRGLMDYAPSCNAAQDYRAFYSEIKEVLNG